MLAQAGLLLAANRLVRILGYGWAARGYECRGARAACAAAVLGSAVCSLGYALLPGGDGAPGLGTSRGRR